MPNISNPDAFALEAGFILAEAYKQLPMPFGWTPDPDTAQYPTELGMSRADILIWTLNWLTSEDYLCKQGMGYVLSQRGLVVLNSVPDQLSGREPLGRRLITAVGKEVPSAIIGLLPFIAEQFTKS